MKVFVAFLGFLGLNWCLDVTVTFKLEVLVHSWVQLTRKFSLFDFCQLQKCVYPFKKEVWSLNSNNKNKCLSITLLLSS